MPINWQDKAVQDRLLMAVIASVDNKINVAEVARLYGEDMTYHAVENYLRRFRKEAKEMKGGAPVAPIPSTPKAKKASVVSPTKAGVKSGRIAKRAPATKIKAEAIEEEMNGEAELDEEEI